MEEVSSSDILTTEQKFVPNRISFEPNEDPEQARRCIEEVREWISTNEDFYGRTDDSFILRFLRVCKFDVERAKQRIYRNYKIEHNNPNCFIRTEEVEEMIEELIGRGTYYLMGYAGNSKEQIVIFDSATFYPMKYPLRLQSCVGLALTTQAVAEDQRTQTHGMIFVGDFAHLKWDVMFQATPSLVWTLLTLATGGAPLKVKGIHVFNAPTIANKVLSFVRYFLSKKLKKRFFVHENVESLFEHVPREHLPFEFGGTAGPSQTFTDYTCKAFKDAKVVYEESRKYGINKRPQSSVHNSNY